MQESWASDEHSECSALASHWLHLLCLDRQGVLGLPRLVARCVWGADQHLPCSSRPLQSAPSLCWTRTCLTHPALGSMAVVSWVAPCFVSSTLCSLHLLACSLACCWVAGDAWNFWQRDNGLGFGNCTSGPT